MFIDDRVLIHQALDAGSVTLGNRVHLEEDTHIVNGAGGAVTIGDDSHIHRGCQIVSYKAPIQIGLRVEIAARCALYSYDHGISSKKHCGDQELTTKGPIIIENGVCLGYGVIVLSGVRIGEGAVIGAGSVVTKDVPAGAIAVGVPARVVGMRTDSGPTDRPVAEGVLLKDDSDFGQI
ncbi:MAG: acyltransferase [Actinomycetota bacterium]